MSYKKYYEGGWQSGEAGGTPITPEALNHMEQGISDAAPMTYAKKVGAPHNLLDNSDFRNPVNQRNAAAAGEWQHCIDRFISRHNNLVLTFAKDGTTLSNSDPNGGGYIYQKVANYDNLLGKKVTLAAKMNGRVMVVTTAIPTSLSNSWYNIVSVSGEAGASMAVVNINSTALACQFSFDVGRSAKIEWVALYEGEYTAETLPEYQPKGYAAELAECQRYFYKIDFSWVVLTVANKRNSNGLRAALQLPVNMRLNEPTVTTSDLAGWTLAGPTENRYVNSIEFGKKSNLITLNMTADQTLTDQAYGIYGGMQGASIEVSADL